MTHRESVVAWWFADGDNLVRCPPCAADIIGDQAVFWYEVFENADFPENCEVCGERLDA